MTTRREAADRDFEAWCDRLWNTHTAKGIQARPAYSWPTPRTFVTNWPGIALDLLVGDWKIRMAHHPDHFEPEIDEALLWPSKVQAREWSQLYADELLEHAGLAFALTQSTDAAAKWLVKRLGLPRQQVEVFQLYLEGYTAREIGRKLSLRPDTVAALLDLDEQGRPQVIRDWLSRQATKEPAA